MIAGIRPTISLLFFLSGIAGLIYEVAWAKHLALVLGNTAHAHTIVLATFMGGLALGYYFFGRIADKTGSALSLYGWMEIGIGLSGALFVPLLGFLGSAYISLLGLFGFHSFVATGLKFLLTILLLLVPTILMGGTLPMLSRFAIRSLSLVDSEVGWLYCVNSLGAVFGSLLAGLLFIPGLGLNFSIVIAAVLNLLVGLVALGLRPWERDARARSEYEMAGQSREVGVYSPMQVRLAVLGIALSGGAALIYEIAWIRLLSLVLGSSTYSFSLMLAAFIAGIAWGSFIVAQRRLKKFDPYLLFAYAELGVALSIIFTLPVYERLPFYFAVLGSLFVRLPETFWLYQFTNFFICFLLMLFPTLFLGMTLPLVSQVATLSLKDLGKNVGKVFAANTLGTLLGAVAAGLLLLPLLGIKRLIEVGVVMNLLAGASALWMAPGPKRGRKVLTLGGGLALFLVYLYLFPAWDKNILSSGTFRLRDFQVGMSYGEFKRRNQEEILYYKDGANMTVAVVQKEDKEITLKVNGKPDASSRGDLPTQVFLGQIPLLLKPEARNVLVIGLGSGVTAGSVLRHPVERLEVVEISPEVVEGSRFFAPYNYEALKDPKLRLHIEDAKTFLKVSQQRYDVIISEPSNPWIAGIGSLYSVEFYQDVRRRLKPDGLMVQWFHSYEMTDETLKLVLRTFVESFRYVTLWSPMAADLMLIGSNGPISVNSKNSLARLGHPQVRGDLRRVGVEGLPTILSLQVASDEGVRKAAGKGPLNEDLFPILEYEAPKAFFLGRTSQFLASYDERRLPRKSSSLYFARHVKEHPLSVEETKNIATYHLNHSLSSSPGLARNFVDLWLRQDPRSLEAHWALARLEEKRGNLEAARKELQYLLQMSPDHRDYLEAAAHVEFQTYLNQRSFLNPKGPEKALAYLHRLLNQEGNKKDRIYRRIAQVYAAERDYESAMGYLDKAAKYAQKNKGESRPDILWLEAANMAIETDDLKTALVYLRQALAHNPGNRVAKRSLEQLTGLVKEGY